MFESKLIIFADKIILGLTLAAPIGPVSVEMIRRGIRNGFASAFSIRLGGAMGNTLCLLGTYFGLSHIMSYPYLINALGAAGSGLLLYMGISALLSQVKTVDLDAKSTVQNGLVFGLYLAIANPVALVFWPGIFAANLEPSTQLTTLDFMENFLIIIGVLIWGAGLSFALDYGNKLLTHKNIIRINKLSGLFMICFGINYLWVIGRRVIEL